MAIAVLTDIHANVVALDAVVADAREHGADRWWLLGDLVAMGSEPCETVQRLRDLDAEARVLGNTDRYVLDDERPFAPSECLELTPRLVDQMVETTASTGWTKGALGLDALTWLRSGEASVTTRLKDGTDVLLVHASQLADDGDGIDPSVSEDRLSTLFADSGAALIVGGHTHQPTDRWVGGRRFVNPGSVSNHHDGLVAQYLAIADDPSGHRLELRTVQYDVDDAIRRVRECGIPGRRFLLDNYFS